MWQRTGESKLADRRRGEWNSVKNGKVPIPYAYHIAGASTSKWRIAASLRHRVFRRYRAKLLLVEALYQLNLTGMIQIVSSYAGYQCEVTDLAARWNLIKLTWSEPRHSAAHAGVHLG